MRQLRHGSLSIALALALAGCPFPPEPAPPTAPQPPAPYVPVCIPPPDRPSPITAATARGTRVEFCVGTGNCFAVDVEVGRLERASGLGEPDLTARARVAFASVDVCRGESCTSLTDTVLPAAKYTRAATDPEGRYLAMLLGDAPRGRGYAEIWQLGELRRVALFRYGSGVFRCGEVAMLDDKAVYVNAAQCGQPTAHAALYRLNGTKVADVGGRDFGTYGGRLTRVDNNVWAFLEENGKQLVVQNVVRGNVVRRIETTPVFKFGGGEMGNPGESAVVRLADGRLVVVAGAPAWGTLGVVDGPTGALTIMPAPMCGAPLPPPAAIPTPPPPSATPAKP